MAPIEQVHGRIKGFNNTWNKMQMDTIGKEDRLRWRSLDKQLEYSRSVGNLREPGTVKLPRAHSSLGPFPGCKRNVVLSPRKSSAIHFIEQKLLRAESEAKMTTMEHMLYSGVSQQEEGKHKYLKLRAGTSLQHRYGEAPATTMQAYGWKKPVFPGGEYRASPFCHKPGVDTAFNRANGARPYLDLPVNNRP
eukprot:TRINITY_DN59093_c0_g1_i1.p1 TRINITY_DN59093_c0_g1~~TRINITY_DN59093_c0_g1_i1.p1  ORF type:complete len:192 (+),score=26.29 TRINITY_DN59093_c0_g1_i1:74-649(+)